MILLDSAFVHWDLPHFWPISELYQILVDLNLAYWNLQCWPLANKPFEIDFSFWANHEILLLKPATVLPTMTAFWDLPQFWLSLTSFFPWPWPSSPLVVSASVPFPRHWNLHHCCPRNPRSHLRRWEDYCRICWNGSSYHLNVTHFRVDFLILQRVWVRPVYSNITQETNFVSQ